MSETVAIDLDTAETLLEVTGTLVDDINSGRRYGRNEDAHERNCAELDAACDELLEAINDAE